MTNVRIVDETFGASEEIERRNVRGTLSLDLRRITVRDLIRFRVEDEMARSEDRLAFLHDLCTGTGANGNAVDRQPRSRCSPPDMVEAAIRRAWNGFDAGSFLVLVNDLQAASLDDPVPLEAENEAIFLRIAVPQGD